MDTTVLSKIYSMSNKSKEKKESISFDGESFYIDLVHITPSDYELNMKEKNILESIYLNDNSYRHLENRKLVMDNLSFFEQIDFFTKLYIYEKLFVEKEKNNVNSEDIKRNVINLNTGLNGESKKSVTDILRIYAPISVQASIEMHEACNFINIKTKYTKKNNKLHIKK